MRNSMKSIAIHVHGHGRGHRPGGLTAVAVTLYVFLASNAIDIPLAASFAVAPSHRRTLYHPTAPPISRLRSRSLTALCEKKDWTTSLFPVFPAGVSSSSPSSPLSPSPSPNTRIIKEQVIPPADTSFVSAAYSQALAGGIGALTGFFIAGFKTSIEVIRESTYGEQGIFLQDFPTIFIPVIGGVAVGILAIVGGGAFPPGVRGIVNQVDKDSLNTNEIGKLDELLGSFRKASAAICTLGTGCSLGPEGPGVEIGIVASRIGTLVWPRQFDELSDNEMVNNAARVRRNRLFLACGAAAGVSSGFNAPLAGVFFALEVVQKNLLAIDIPAPTEVGDASSSDSVYYELQQESLSTEASSITPIITSSVVSALVVRLLLKDELALRLLEYEIPTPLRELPIYLLLGAMSGLTAVTFSQVAKLAKAGFDGEIGPQPVREAIEATPEYVKPVIGGLTCGVVGYFFPNILFFGYETLNGLLSNNQITTDVAFTLLVAKIFATAVSAASGLVGGILAPSLFMGGMVGVSFHNILVNTLDVSTFDFTTPAFGTAFQIADLPAYTMVGAASCLSAVFRAPLTGSLLAFELTKNYDVLVPLLASAGVGTLVCDLVESRIDQAKSR